MISFIIPAHNEEALLGRTLSALHESAHALGEPYEILVANDTSTDRTAALALEHRARVVAVNRRQIAASATPGAGGDGRPVHFRGRGHGRDGAGTAGSAADIARGAVGGGCSVHVEGRLPLYAVVLWPLLSPLFHVFGLAPGCFLFCTRRAYFAAGGFNEALYWGEEVAFGRRLKRQGRFVMLHEFVTTSGRKLPGAHRPGTSPGRRSAGSGWAGVAAQGAGVLVRAAAGTALTGQY